MERHHTCINGHSLRAIGEGEEPTNTQETYVIRPCRVCERPTEFKWPLRRKAKLVGQGKTSADWVRHLMHHLRSSVPLLTRSTCVLVFPLLGCETRGDVFKPPVLS